MIRSSCAGTGRLGSGLSLLIEDAGSLHASALAVAKIAGSATELRTSLMSPVFLTMLNLLRIHL